jgi:hypothetical protein
MLSFFRRTIYFNRFLRILVLSVLLFSTAGIHFVHHFFHHCPYTHYRHGSYFEKPAECIPSLSLIYEKYIEPCADQNCFICSFLKQFRIYKIHSHVFLSLFFLLIFRFLFEPVIFKQNKFLLALPRLPPYLFSDLRIYFLNRYLLKTFSRRL